MTINTPAQALDFARHIIPWVQEHSKLQRKGMKLPEIQMLDDVEGFIRQHGNEQSYNHTHQPKELRQHLETRGAYSPELNLLLLSTEDNPTAFEDINRLYRESVIVHELTHFLQNANGLLRQETVPECEMHAYAIQAHYLASNGINVEPFNLTPEAIMIVSGMAAKHSKLGKS